MLEKPDLSDELIISHLQHLYGLAVIKLEFLPIGNDATTWVYKVLADNLSTHFLKVKYRTVVPASVLVPYALHKSGINSVVSAIPSLDDSLWKNIQNFTLILYPFIDGQTGMSLGLSTEQWREFGAILKQIHATQLPPEIAANVPREFFVLNRQWTLAIWEIQQRLKEAAFKDALEEQLALFWQERAEEITRIISRTEELGCLLQAQSLPFVLCHADIHTANMLIDQDGQLFIVDWDQIIFAPKERDLMFVIDNRDRGMVQHQSEPTFFDGYGQTTINWLTIAYYRYEWVVQEIADFGERVFLTPNIGSETKQDAINGFMQLFLPDDVIASAYDSEAHLT